MSSACEYPESYWKSSGQAKGEITDLPYAPRARFLGNLDWLCPKCGHIQTHKLQKGSWRVTCKAMECRKSFGIAIQFMDLRNRSLPHPPIDYIFPDTVVKDSANHRTRFHSVAPPRDAEMVQIRGQGKPATVDSTHDGLREWAERDQELIGDGQGKSTSSVPAATDECDR